jgi:RNA polymerase sigma-70 factor (ECF subfamily)
VELPLRAGEAVEDAEAGLVARARAGDAGALEALYRAHVGELSRHARHLVHGRAEAEDLVQEAFVAAFESLPRFRGEAPFAGWLHRIALNLARHRWRARARRRALLKVFAWLTGVAAADDSTPDRAAEAGDAARLLRSAVAALSPKLREAFVLLAVERLPGEEAAKLAGVRPAALRVRALRARRRVREYVRAARGEEP